MFGFMGEPGTPGDASRDLLTGCQGPLGRSNYCPEKCKVIPSNSWAVLFPKPVELLWPYRGGVSLHGLVFVVPQARGVMLETKH